MLRSVKELQKHLKNQCYRITADNDKSMKIAKLNWERHNIPTGTTMDMIASRVDLETMTEFMLFCLAEAIDIVFESHKLSLYFTEKEISMYSEARIDDVEKVKFPIVIPCLQVTPDQWIGASDVQFIMKLRDSQMIHYNPDAQRVMKRVSRCDKESFVISINKNATKQIKESFESESFIPNTITLNIPYDSDADFYYDKDGKQLVIKSLDHFDMSDGYHRYYSMCMTMAENPDFNYPMEIRIINFSDTKVKQFIYQEDQKTKMTKVNSDSMNMYSPANIVAEGLNQDIDFVMKGAIARSGGQIPLGEFARVIEYFYFRNASPKENQRVKIVETKKEIKRLFNLLAEHNISYLEKTYEFHELLVIVYIFKEYDMSDAEKLQKIDRCIFGGITKEDLKLFGTKRVARTQLKLIDKIAEV